MSFLSLPLPNFIFSVHLVYMNALIYLQQVSKIFTFGAK
jgi:hypothetical protein